MPSVIQAEANQIGSVARIDPTLSISYAADARRIAGSERYSVAQAQARGLHDIGDGVVHLERGARQSRTTCEPNAAIGVQLDVNFTQTIWAG